jgi:hypothetical protein
MPHQYKDTYEDVKFIIVLVWLKFSPILYHYNTTNTNTITILLFKFFRKCDGVRKFLSKNSLIYFSMVSSEQNPTVDPKLSQNSGDAENLIKKKLWFFFFIFYFLNQIENRLKTFLSVLFFCYCWRNP